MIRILLSLLLLEVCVGKVDIEHSNYWASFGGSSSSDDELVPRVVRHAAEQKMFGAKNNYLATIIYIDLPRFSDFIDVGFVSENTDKFNILFNNIKFSKLSSAYALSYRIDLDANAVQVLLRLGRAHINGTYCLSTPSSPNTAYDDFELNLFADLIYSHNILFHVDEKEKPTFGKVEHQHLSYKKVKGHYAHVPSALAADVDNYLSPKLLDAIVEKISEEVRAKVSLDHVGFQIMNEMAFRYRSHIADRFKKAITDAFEDVHLNCFNIFYYDRTNFKRIVQNYDVRIPSFILRDVEKFEVHDMKISFVDEDVHIKGVFRIASPLAVMRIMYCNRHNPQALNHTVKAEYQIWDGSYEFEMIAKPETNTVELGNVAVHISGVSVAPTQGLYGDERDLIIQQLVQYIKTFYPANGYHVFSSYLEGLLAEGRIAYEVFKE